MNIRIKKAVSCMVMMALIMYGVSGCGNNIVSSQGSDKIEVVCTIFPQYDWVREIIGDSDNIELSLLVDNGVDLHSYQPTADDIITISECDVFIYVGGESDAWVENILAQASNKDMTVINMIEILGESVKEEEIVEGMDDGHAHDENHTDEDADGNSAEYDEHIWLSLKNAVSLCGYITDVLGQLDADNQDIYDSNLQAYTDKLNALDAEYKNAVDTRVYDTVLFGDRFPFLYMVKDYGINYYAAFAGCSAETEASFETVAFLAGRLNELGLPVVLVAEDSDKSLADTIISSTDRKDQTVLVMNSMQSVTEKDINEGETYIGIMQDNLVILKQALGSGM